MSQYTWDVFFIRMAELTSTKSKDKSTKVGAVVVGVDNEVRGVGYNSFPRGVNDDIESRHLRPAKYSLTCHAEANSVFNAARVGIPLKGCRLYLSWYPWPCSNCAMAIIQSGIIEVIGPDRPFVSPGSMEGRADWEASFVFTRQMFQEAGVVVRVVEIPLTLRKELGWEA